MLKFTLQAKIRDMKATPSALRSQGLVPVELYGHGVENMHLAVVFGELNRVYKQAGATSIVEIEIEGNGKRAVLINQLQHHYLTGDVIHADFHQVSLTEKIRANIPLVFIGESKAIKEQAGVLVKLVSELEVEAFPQDLPHELSVDISKLVDFESSITVSDIAVPANVTVITPQEEAIANVQPPRDVEKELAEPVAEVSAADVETVEKKGKAEEDGQEAEKA